MVFLEIWEYSPYRMIYKRFIAKSTTGRNDYNLIAEFYFD